MAGQDLYKIQTVVRMTGLSEPLLRAWERRFDILDPQRGAGGHRLYAPDDIEILRYLKAAIHQGRSIGELALLGRKTLLAQAREKIVAPQQPESSRMFAVGAESARASLVDAALAMDRDGLNTTLDRALAVAPAETVIDQVLEPAARDIGELWAAGKCGIVSEHLASGVFEQRLLKLIEAAQPAVESAPLVLSACFPDERHQIGALVLNFYLAKGGFKVVHLGPALPFEDLDRACERLHPKAVFVSVTRQANYDAYRSDLIGMLRRRGTEVPCFLGGMGAPLDDQELLATGIIVWPRARSSGGVAAELRARLG